MQRMIDEQLKQISYSQINFANLIIQQTTECQSLLRRMLSFDTLFIKIFQLEEEDRNRLIAMIIYVNMG